MSHFYLVASLPTLHLDDPPPFSVEDFRFRCQGVLSERERHELDAVLDGRPEEGRSRFAREWYALDTQLRNAVARFRAGQLGVDPRNYLQEQPGYSSYVDKAVTEALGRSNPLERERGLDQCRWYLLGELAGLEAFGLAAVLAFGAQLGLVARWSAIQDEAGRQRFDQLVSQNLKQEGYLTEMNVEVLTP